VRIIVFCPHFEDTGGVREVVARVAEEHVRSGHGVDVVTRARSDGAETSTASAPPGVALWRVPLAPAPHRGAGGRAARRFVRRFARNALPLAARVRRLRPDVVATHCSKFYAPWAAVLATAGAPLIVHLHNAERTADGPESPLWTRLLLRTARRVIAVSPAVAAYAQRMRPVLEGRIHVIRNGVAPEPPGIPPEARPQPFLLAVGRLSAQKGIDVLLDALARTRTAVPLVIAGDGPDRGALADRAARLGVGARVDFLGDVSHDRVLRLLRGATAVVMPSRFEGNPLIALEAMQAGAALVASRIPGLPPELEDGATGLLVPPDDAGSLAAVLDRVLADTGERVRLGRAAAAAARRMPTWQHTAAEILGVYERTAHST
jgi:glycogen(starch) synthase